MSGGEKSEWRKSEKHRALILHITVLLIQTPRSTSLCAFICGYIFHRLTQLLVLTVWHMHITGQALPEKAL